MNFTFHLNLHTILPILCIPLALICGLFVISQNPKAKLNRLFFTICITFMAWFSFYIPYNFNYTEETLIQWYKISYCFISFIPVSSYSFITSYLEAHKNELWLKINSAIGFTFSILSLTTNWIIEGINYFPWFPYPQAGILHPFLVSHCLILAYLAIRIMLKSLKNSKLSSQQRNHIKYMLGAIVTLSFGAIDFIGNYSVKIYQIGHLAVAGYLIITTIAIIKHQLMDIRIVLKKSLIYSLLIIIIALFYFLSIYLTEKAVEKIFGYQSVVISLFFATVIAIAFIPIKNFIEKYIFHKDLGVLAEENELFQQEILQTEKLKSISILASGMAHEIKNPLTVLKTFSEYLPQRLEDKNFLRKFAPIISQEVDRMDNLVHELLDFARPSPPNLQTVNIHDLIDKVLDLLNNEFIKHNIKIQKDFSLKTNTSLQLDYNQIKQVFLNIFLNAIEAMPRGGQLNISTHLSMEKNKTYIKIRDTGTGISPKDLNHIFDPFFSKKDNGTGLGLSITHEIIKKHGGKILAESVEGKGTTFILEFPL